MIRPDAANAVGVDKQAEWSASASPMMDSVSSSLNAANLSTDHSIQTSVLGYDFEFVPTVDAKYVCPICMLVLRSPVQTECGHRFCGSCIRRWLSQKTGGETECPNCKEKLTVSQIFPDNFAKREIMNLTLRCPNAKHGCDAIIDLHHVQLHIDNACEYALCPCPNSCSDILLKKDLKHHITVTCPKLWTTCNMCQERISSSSLQSHLQTCRMSMDLCPHCGIKVIKNRLKNHQDVECPHVTVNCLFLPFGCQHKCNRNLLSRHVETSVPHHLNLVSKIVMMLMQWASASPSASAAKSLELPDSGFQFSVFSHKIDRDQVHAIGTKNENQEPCDFITNVTDAGFVSSVSSPSLDAASSRHGGPFISSSPMTSAVEGSYESPEIASRDSGNGSTESRTSTEDTRYATVLHELRQNVLVLQQIFAQHAKRLSILESLPDEIVARQCNGRYLWRIDNVDRHRQSARNGTTTALHSQGFYTSLYGYKICIRINLNGIDKGCNKYIALFVHLMKGDYDEILDWPFNGTITLSILDQEKSGGVRKDYTESLEANPNLTAFAKPTSNRNHKGFGYVEFAPLSVLDESRYVKNSVLFICATVKVS